MLAPTIKLYWKDDHCTEAEAQVLETRENAIALDRTCFYPGGGGQPHDTGTIRLSDGNLYDITSVHADEQQIIWHTSNIRFTSVPGSQAILNVDPIRRRQLARYHTVLHILNTTVLRDYNGWITGVQISPEYSRIDFKLENFSPRMCAEIEEKVNAVIKEDHPMKSFFLTEAEFQKRDDLLRTLQVQPPVYDGKIRVVEIQGFDAQACGGTHLASTREIGVFHIYKTENKGKINKRLYVRLTSFDL